MRSAAASDAPEPLTAGPAPIPTRRERIEALLELLVVQATGGGGDNAAYVELRRELLTDPAIGPRIPRYVRMSRDLGQFWEWIRDQRPSYTGRRELLWTDFAPIVDHAARLEAAGQGRVVVPRPPLDREDVYAAWRDALARRGGDPAGAVAAARALLERVCRHVLERCARPYAADATLAALYRLVAAELQLAPGQHVEQVVTHVLGGCEAVADGLEAVRYRLHDAHESGRVAARGAARHAELAVNLAGSVALFLISTADARGGA